MTHGMNINGGRGTKFNVLDRDKQHLSKAGFKEGQGPRILGLGRGASGRDAAARDRFIGAIQSAQNTPTVNIPVIDHVTWHFDGALTDAAIGATFGTTIDPLGSSVNSPPAGCSQVDTTFAEPGKFQTFALVCGIQFRIDIVPLSFTAPINLWTAPTTSSAKPVSPDVFSVKDGQPNGPLGLLQGQTMIPGQFEYGWWQDLMAYYMFRGYNLQWQYGHNYNIINDGLVQTASISTTGEASASSSEVDIQYFLRQANDYYRGTLNSPFTALELNAIRLGNMTLPPTGDGATAGLSVFKPSRAYERVGTTFNGGFTRPFFKGQTTQFRRLSSPFLAWPGVPLGLKAQVSNEDDQLQMQKFMSATYGVGGAAPGIFSEDANISVGATVSALSSQTSQEPSLDNPIAPQFIQQTAGRAPVKGGAWNLTMAFKGYELTPDQAAMVQMPDYRNIIQNECSCGIGVPGGS